ncbi:hypothetical protein [Hymenobacter coalescens]
MPHLITPSASYPWSRSCPHEHVKTKDALLDTKDALVAAKD